MKCKLIMYLIFVAGEKLNLNLPESFYRLGGGGDESKKTMVYEDWRIG